MSLVHAFRDITTGRPRVGGGVLVDMADRLNCRVSFNLALLCTLILSCTQYVFKSSITCHIANPISGMNLEGFVEGYCWIHGTFIPPRHPNNSQLKVWDDKSAHFIIYYQWIPLWVAMQALLFYLPNLIWGVIGGELRYLREQLKKLGEKDEWGKVVKIIRYQTSTPHLFVGYLVVKLLYIVNSLGQLAVMFFYVANGGHTQFKHLFPTQTFCQIPLEHLGRTNKVTAQCLLPANLIHEKMFCLLGVWLSLVTVINIGSVSYWVVVVLLRRHKFIRKYHKLLKLTSPPQRQHTMKYTMVFLLHLIKINVGELITMKLVDKLWEKGKIVIVDQREEDFSV